MSGNLWLGFRLDEAAGSGRNVGWVELRRKNWFKRGEIWERARRIGR